MIARQARTLFERGLPRLAGRPLWAYRLAWVVLAAAALASVAAMLVDGAAAAIVGLRMLKSVLVLGVATLLFWRRQRDPVAALLALAFLCWIVTSNVDFTTGAVLPMLFDRVRFLLFALALLLFPDGTWLPRSNAWVAVASIIVCLLGVFEVLVAQTSLYLPLAIGCILIAIGTLIERFRSTLDEGERQQLKWVALGLAAGVGAILTARAGNAVAAPRLPLEALFQIGIVVIALGFLVPLLRYRLYDAEAAISRSAALAVLTVALVATFAGAEAIIEWAGQQFLGMGIGNVSAAMAAAVAAVLLSPLHSRISDWAEQRFQHDLAQLKAGVPELLDQIPSSWDPRQLANAVLPLIIQAVHAKGASITLDAHPIAAAGDPATAEDGALELALPCRFGEPVGQLLIGPRLDGCPYGMDDVEALKAILPSLSRAIFISFERHEARQRAGAFEQHVQAQLACLISRTEELERRLSAEA